MYLIFWARHDRYFQLPHAGAARIGLITRSLLGAPAAKAEIVLHGSFAKTYKGHGTDRAIVAGSSA